MTDDIKTLARMRRLVEKRRGIWSSAELFEYARIADRVIAALLAERDDLRRKAGALLGLSQASLGWTAAWTDLARAVGEDNDDA